MAMVLLEAARRVLTRAAATASGGAPMEELLGDRCASERQPRRPRARLCPGRYGEHRRFRDWVGRASVGLGGFARGVGRRGERWVGFSRWWRLAVARGPTRAYWCGFAPIHCVGVNLMNKST